MYACEMRIPPWPRLLLGIGAAVSPLFLLAWAGSRKRGLAGPAADRAIARKSYREEETAIRAYGQRYKRAEDPRLKKAIMHARREEITHAASFKPLMGGLGELPAALLARWKRGIAAYKKAISEIESGDREGFERAVRARNKLDKLIDEAAAHAPGSYKDPAVEALDTEKSALPKITDAEERGRQARGRQYDAERKRLTEEIREERRETDWMKR